MNVSFKNILFASASLFFLSHVALASEPAGKPADEAETQVKDDNSKTSKKSKTHKKHKDVCVPSRKAPIKAHIEEKKEEQCPEDNGGFVRPEKDSGDKKTEMKTKGDAAS